MKRRENELVATYRSLRENREKLAEAELNKINESKQLKENFVNKYNNIIDSRNRNNANHARLLEGARDNALSTVLKAIYITALEANTLTDDGIILAESMVDNYIKENGGASKILGKVCNNTYFLARLTQIVEDAAQEEVKDIEKDDEKAEQEEKEEKENKIKSIALTAAEEFIKKASDKETEDFISKIQGTYQDKVDDRREKREEAKANKEEDSADTAEVEDDGSELKVPEDDTDSKESDDKAEDDDSLNMSFDDSETGDDADDKAEEDKGSDADDTATDEPAESDKNDDSEAEPEDKEATEDDSEDEKDSDNDGVSDQEEKENEDETEEELGEPLDGGDTSDITVDGDTSNKGKLFDQLDKEEDVQKAVEIIRSRVADAEETFIKNNAEDKKKIDELLNKISNNVKTVEDLNDDNSTDSKIAQESAKLYKKQIDNIRNSRPLTIFERMTRDLTANIVRESAVRESYLTESGVLDINHVVESAKVMYGFLETVNTLQLEKVDASYIEKVLDSINK